MNKLKQMVFFFDNNLAFCIVRLVFLFSKVDLLEMAEIMLPFHKVNHIDLTVNLVQQ
jgi:hypothetical protein